MRCAKADQSLGGGCGADTGREPWPSSGKQDPPMILRRVTGNLYDGCGAE